MCILKCGKDINSYDRTVGYNDMVQGINNSKLWWNLNIWEKKSFIFH